MENKLSKKKNLSKSYYQEKEHIKELDFKICDCFLIKKKLKPTKNLIKFCERVSEKLKDADLEYLITNYKQIRKLLKSFKRDFSWTFGNSFEK